ncbi:YeiH family protein [Halohasta salina]|uniref:YeiH family protein n=1 Tax=Halohasta salina TaxID=2961621 RepID=UPI0020A4204F|nr:putative sulfate exporter family transporter [Halohasta salina]
MRLTRLLPGVAVLCGGAILSRAIARVTGVPSLLVAIGIGAVLVNGPGVPDRYEPGLGTHNLWLAGGIVLMGASLTLGTIREAGVAVLLVVVAVAGLTIGVVELLSRRVFGLDDKLGSLLAAGAGICGVSAVVAVGGAVRGREDQIAYAAATVLLFDAVTLVVYPIAGELLGLSDVVFGIWTGVSMFSTGPVVAVGVSYSEVAGQWATLTKLARNALIGVVVVAYAAAYARTEADGRLSARTLWEEFPTFIFGFLALAVFASLSLFSPTQLAAIDTTYSWLFSVAFVGLGSEIHLGKLRNTGLRPIGVVLLSLVIGSSLSLAVLTAVF